MHTSRRTMHHLLTAAALGLAVAVASADSPVGNVVFYEGEFPDNPGQVLATRSVPGYTQGIVVPYNGSQVTIGRLQQKPGTGFGPLGNIVVNQVLPSSAFVAVNQVSPDLAAAFFGNIGTPDITNTEVEPRGGDFYVTRRIVFRSTFPDATFEYSRNGAPFQQWKGEALFVEDGLSLQFRGTSAMAGGTGPTRTANYTVQLPPCYDTDNDLIPDRIELLLGRDPLVADSDQNLNLLDDFDEVLRGIANFQAGSTAPLFVDTDGDRWSDYDENLRGTATNDPTDFPASPNLRTVEHIITGSTVDISNGTAPPIGNATVPYPTSLRYDAVNPGGVAPQAAVASNTSFGLRVPREQFRYLRARAEDGTGRMLLAPIAPARLCINFNELCGNGETLANWRTALRKAYEAQVFGTIPNVEISPRSTVAALLLNRYYEVNYGEAFIPGVAGKGPSEDQVTGLQGLRDQQALLAQIEASVSPVMVDLVNDFHRFHVKPGERAMTAVLADLFAGRAVQPAEIPAGVRTENLALISGQTTTLMNSIGDGSSILTGAITVVEGGYLLTTGQGIFTLEGISDTFINGTMISVRADVDVDGCGFNPRPARVTELISRGIAPLPPVTDSDGDGLADDWEYYYFGDLSQGAHDDQPDEDGFDNAEEQANGTNPTLPDNGPFIGFQGDANLDLVVNAVDLLVIQDALGADYTCRSCRGLGDANGSRMVTNEDFISSQVNFGVEYGGPAPCAIATETCNGRSAPRAYSELRGLSAEVRFEPSKLTAVPGEVITVDVVLETGSFGWRASSIPVRVSGSALPMVGQSAANASVFDVVNASRRDGPVLTLGGLAGDDRSDSTTIGSFQVVAGQGGRIDIAMPPIAPQIAIVSADGTAVDFVISEPVSIVIEADNLFFDGWILR